MYSCTPTNLLVDYFCLLGCGEIFLPGSPVFFFDNTSDVILCLHPLVIYFSCLIAHVNCVYPCPS